MKIYHYHGMTKVLLGSSDADESPLEPGVFLIPANAVTVPPPEIPEGMVAAWVGDAWAIFTPQPEPEPGDEPELYERVPKKVTVFQGQAALYQAGLLDDIEAYMALETTDWRVKLAWKKAQNFERGSDMIDSLKTLFGLTDTQIDDLFIFAKTIN